MRLSLSGIGKLEPWNTEPLRTSGLPTMEGLRTLPEKIQTAPPLLPMLIEGQPFIDAQDDAPQGGGEPAMICMGGAIANAVYDVTGARLTQLPMTPERVLQALKARKG